MLNERKVESLRLKAEYPIPPTSHIKTPFRSIKEWLQFLCEHEHYSVPISEYLIAFSEPPGILACLVGYNQGIEQGTPTKRIVFQPGQYMWFKLPTKKYGGKLKNQLIAIIHSELKEFFDEDVFKQSFLARGYRISTTFQKDIWSK